MLPVECWVSLGSNYQRSYQLARALQALQARFGPLRVSRTFETQPVGIKVVSCAAFYNLVAGFTTSLRPGAVNAVLKEIEANTTYLLPEDKSTYVRALDLDLVSWNDTAGQVDGLLLPYPNLLQHDFVLLPLAELVPHQRPAGFQQTYLELWHEYAHPEQHMQPVELNW